MSDDSSARTARNALITTVVAILMNPVSVALGYYLNQRLHKPRISIEYISDSYTEFSHTLSPKIAGGISGDSDLTANIRDTLTRIANERGVEPCVAWLDDASSWEDRCVPLVREVANGIIGALLAGSSRTRDPSVPQASVVKAELTSLRSLLRELDKMDASPTTERTGNVSFPLGVLNTGDADEIIFNRATLRFEGKELWLSAHTYTIAKGPSFQEIEFSIPENDQDATALAAWQKLVKARAETSFEFVLKTGTGPVVKTGQLHK